MISVAAELAEMHPQTLRMYEARGLIEPKRSPKGTRLYSQDDVERLRRIQEMTNELGLNLAGVERVLELEEQLERASRRLEQLERRSAGAARGDGGRDGARPRVVPRRDRALPPAGARTSCRAAGRAGRATPPAASRSSATTADAGPPAVRRCPASSRPRPRPGARPPGGRGCRCGRSCGLISSWASGVSPSGRLVVGGDRPQRLVGGRRRGRGVVRARRARSWRRATRRRAPHTLEQKI